MVCKNLLDLKNSIDDDRLVMYELAKNKELSDPDVINISHKIDRKIIILQKMIHAACS
ncbi:MULTISPECIES: Spo0E family sporulation regulatory protein-aspartic acid phosphatase [Bacillaceae]|uniref:Spo0E family sporulation regulatory protein-aspartic acid phosphatase n=1 Tax=Bacillaceae TaxID=186817 RepID=UPI00037EC2EF|nr:MULTISPECIES: Spo0E family sporulation regulatory protein-aspartic acid phosphatase [Bacillaceae]